MNRNIVFDIDGTIARAVSYQPEKVVEQVKAKFGTEFYKRHCIDAYNYPHFIRPGFYALFKWLYQNEAKLFFFSTGIEERNIELVDKLMQISFPDNYKKVEYKVFSRQHCVNTNSGFNAMNHEMQGLFFGNLKKKLAGYVVPKEEIADTLLIDDDRSYLAKGEEKNLIYVREGLYYIEEAQRNQYIYFLTSYYIAGLLSEIFNLQKEKGYSLIDATYILQVEREGSELDRNFHYEGISRQEYYKTGFQILKQIDPTLELYYSIPETRPEHI